MPDTTLDGVQGAGNLGGSGLVGIGGEYISDQSSGVGVLGFGGPPSRLSQVSNPAGVGVKGIAGGAADGVVGTSDAPSKSGVFGFNSLSSTKTDVAGYGVFGRCDTVGGTGVEAESGHGVGVRGHSRLNDAIVGLSDANSKSGVYGFNSSPKGVAFGVFGRANSARGAGVAGASENGYGGSFRGGQAPMRLQPSDSQGAPTTGARLSGEFYVDSAGDLYFCKTGGNGTAAKWVKLA